MGYYSSPLSRRYLGYTQLLKQLPGQEKNPQPKITPKIEIALYPGIGTIFECAS